MTSPLYPETPPTFSYFYRQAFLRPGVAFERLIQHPSSLRFSFWAVSVPALLYTMVYVFLIMGGGQPFKPWLDIPLESYYRYNVFFCAPSMLLGWILAAGVVHVISRGITALGTFDNTLCLFGFGIGVASWATGFHDILTSFLGAVHVIDQHQYEVALNSPTPWRTLLWIQMIGYLAWFIVLFYLAVKTVYKLKTPQAIALGTLGFVIYQLFFLIFNR